MKNSFYFVGIVVLSYIGYSEYSKNNDFEIQSFASVEDDTSLEFEKAIELKC